MSHYRRKALFIFLLFIVALGLFPFAWSGLLAWWYDDHIFTADDPPTKPVAIVFGARVYANGRLSSMLRDRVDTAVQLYENGFVQKIIMSGDNQTEFYNEPEAMITYALNRGIPSEALQPDYGGRRTYDTCYRAREIFQVETAVLITQEFHLPRALFTCRNLGVDVSGVIADQRQYSQRSLAWSETREIAASLNALLDVILQRPAPVLGDPIPLELN